MIWSDARVTMADGKTQCPLEDLQIGEWLLNPLTGKPQEVIDILKRSPVGAEGACLPGLMPHRIRADSFGPGLPQRDIWLSPAQVILASNRQRTKSYSGLSHVVAGQAGAADLPARGRYAAIFLDQQSPIILEGLPVAGYHLSCLDRHEASPSGRTAAPSRRPAPTADKLQPSRQA